MNKAIAAFFAVILALGSNDGESLQEVHVPHIMVQVHSVVTHGQHTHKAKPKKRKIK
jgi:hypothetical protein